MNLSRGHLLALLAVVLALALSLSSLLGASGFAAPVPDLTPTASSYLPIVVNSTVCPDMSLNEYHSGTAYQFDRDQPVRLAHAHADKNIELRGYTPNTDPSYPLPNLPAGKPIGVARGSQVVIAISDTGSFQDPRSLNDWWQIRPGYPGEAGLDDLLSRH